MPVHVVQDDLDLVARSAAPMLDLWRSVTPSEQPATFRKLDEDQQALFCFWALFGHLRGGLSGCAQVLPHRIASPGFWLAVEGALRRIGDGEMLSLIERWRALLEPALAAAGAWAPNEQEIDMDFIERATTALGTIDPQAMSPLEAECARLLPGALHRMAEHIRQSARARAGAEAEG